MKIKKDKNLIKVAIDSPAAAGAGTQAKLISKHYNLYYLDTGKIYRYIGELKLKYNYVKLLAKKTFGFSTSPFVIIFFLPKIT